MRGVSRCEMRDVRREIDKVGFHHTLNQQKKLLDFIYFILTQIPLSRGSKVVKKSG